MAKKNAITLQQLNAQIERLQMEADALKKKEVAEVIAKIKDAIAHYRLTAADLGLVGRGKVRLMKAGKSTDAKANPGKKKTAGVIRFRDKAGNSWTGHGRRPAWFVAAIAAGVRPEELAV
jgi:DNA-binding protein H-NS